MAFDWVHSLLFYVTYTCSYTYDIVFDGGRMFVVDLRTMQSRILTDNDLHEPGALAVDPSLGLLFWTDTAVRRVDRSGMDGSQRTRFPSRYGDYKIQWVSSLALDLAERRVYWADGESPRGVYSTDYHGSNFRTVLQSSFRGDPRLIAISAEWLVWTTSYAIWATSKCSNESVA
ncbi:Protein T13C2.6 a, partial [Aphelenchoides avenae]